MKAGCTSSPATADGIVNNPRIRFPKPHIDLEKVLQAKRRDSRTELVADAADLVDHLEDVARAYPEILVRREGLNSPERLIISIGKSVESA